MSWVGGKRGDFCGSCVIETGDFDREMGGDELC